MKYGLYVHQFVEDPSHGDDSFGRVRPGGTIECSEDGSKLKQYIENRKVIEELSKEYRMSWHNSLVLAA
ncbi:hypothetical protein KY326_04815, partial [Candidatus Woesearchaeota archaeon]|nr:hypothetical protein [Candidatus Woesearchaeota archaeon]